MKEIPPGPPSATPHLYMTPQLAKRKDGLCMSMLGPSSSIEKPGHVTKPYQTNSSLLIQIKENEGMSRETSEIHTIIENISKSLKSIAKPEHGINSISFNPEGCVWKLELADPNTTKTYKMQVICSARKSSDSLTVYVADTILIPKVAVDPDPLAPEPKGFKEAKTIFDMVALKVRKAVVRIEFPEFPEGCKGRPFREVYQLNARVRWFFCRCRCGQLQSELICTHTNRLICFLPSIHIQRS
jgi:hypothetical protein